MKSYPYPRPFPVSEMATSRLRRIYADNLQFIRSLAHLLNGDTPRTAAWAARDRVLDQNRVIVIELARREEPLSEPTTGALAQEDASGALRRVTEQAEAATAILQAAVDRFVRVALTMDVVIAPEWEAIWCDACEQVCPFIVDVLPANGRNDHDCADLVCGRCHLVINTLHATVRPTETNGQRGS